VARFGLKKKETTSESPAGSDVVQLVIRYVKQEMLGPFQGLARSVAVGVLGSVAVALGVALLLLAALRVLQTETGAFHGNLSWLPYLIVAALAGVVMALAIWRITRGPAGRRGSPPDGDGD
jgi:hypothetical protein